MNIVVANLKKSKTRNATDAGSVRAKRVRNLDGKFISVWSMDANSKSFIDDLTLVFKKNVAKARQENKRLFGSLDWPNKAKSKRTGALVKHSVRKPVNVKRAFVSKSK